MGLEDLKNALQVDTNYLRYRSLRNNAAKTLPYEGCCEELDRIQASRLVRSTSYDMKPDKLLDISMNEVSYRARCTEILIIAKRRSADLGKVIDATRLYVSTTYAHLLLDLKTKGERDSTVASFFIKGVELQASLSSLAEQAELVIKDIDQTSFALTRIANVFELVIRREKLINVDI